MMVQSNSHKVMKGVSAQTVVTLLFGIVEVATFSIMSRLLSKDDFGYFAALTAVTSVFSALSDTGIGSAIVQQKNVDKKYLDNAFTLSFAIGVLLMLLLCALSDFLATLIVDNSIKVPLVIISCTLLLSCVSSVPRSILHKNRMFYKMGVSRLFTMLLSTSVAIFLAAKGFGYYSILVKVVLDGLLLYLVSLFLAKTSFSLAWDWNVIKKIFNFSGWLMASALFRNLSQSIDSLIMPRLMSVTLLGAYNRPKGFIRQISMQLNEIFDSALFPVLSEMQDDNNAIKNAYKASIYYLNIFAMVLSLSFIFNSEFIIRIFFGEQWLDLGLVFMILSISLVVNVDGRLNDCYLRSLGLTRTQFIFRIVEFAVNVLFYVVGSHWGLIGFAVGGVMANFVLIFAKMMYLNKKIHTSFLEILMCLISSWRAGIVFIPLMIALHLLLPNNFIGNIVNCVCMMILYVLIFVFFPSVVRKKYKDDIYPKMNQRFKAFIRKA